MIQRLLRGIAGLSDAWIGPGLLMLLCLGISASFGGRAWIALRQHGTLDTVVMWFGRGNGNVSLYSVRELLVRSVLWALGAGAVFVWGRFRFRRAYRP